MRIVILDLDNVGCCVIDHLAHNCIWENTLWSASNQILLVGALKKHTEPSHHFVSRQCIPLGCLKLLVSSIITAIGLHMSVEGKSISKTKLSTSTD